MRLKFFKKYFFATLVIVLFSLTALFMILTVVFNSYISSNKFDLMEQTCKTVTDFLEEPPTDSEYLNQGVYYIISNLSNAGDIDIFMTDREGTVKLCACEEWLENGSCTHSAAVVPKNILNTALKGDFSGRGTLGLYRQSHNIYAKPVITDDECTAIVFSVAEALPVKSLVATVVKMFFFSAAVPIVIMFFILYFMTYRMIKPLKLMSEAAKAMAKGDFSKRIPVTSDDEIGELAVSFNQMTNSLVQLESMRKSFVANVSHELKTPMTTIGGFIDGIIDGTIEPSREEYYLKIVSDEVKRLSRMVESMLSLSKLESGEFILKPEAFDFKELLLNVVISQEQRIERKKITISGLDEIESVSLIADRDLIYQVIYNLVDNAIKFVNDGGTISFSLKPDSKKLIFDISNTGKGIPPEELQYVFERFYKVDKSRSANKNSSGLGLYIVKTIVGVHGGKISAESNQDGVTDFKVMLPRTK